MHIFIHIGDHKTGTTSIQAFLRSHAEELRSAGIYVPVSGTNSLTSGHHNLAFQLNGDPRWNPDYGGMDELLDELRRCRLSQVVISSEDFCLLVDHPMGLKKLESALLQQGYALSWLMFLRRVDDFSESCYCEMRRYTRYRLRFGYPGFAFVALLLGKYREKYFDYNAFASRWRRLSSSPIHFYDYDEAVQGEGVLSRFMEAIHAPPALLAGSLTQPFLNKKNDRILRRYRRLFRPLLMARFHSRNARLLEG